MLTQAANHAPYYQGSEWATRLRSGQAATLDGIGITPKSDVRERTGEFYSSFMPRSAGEIITKLTSGSTGEPMVVRKTTEHFRINALENQRLKDGWGLERQKRVVQLNVPRPHSPAGTLKEEVDSAGRTTWTLHTADTSEAFDLVWRTGATLLKSAPSMALGVFQCASDFGRKLPIRLVSTISEIVPDELRSLVGDSPGCRLMDSYGCIETGLIAVQCPSCNAYHAADRHLILEIVDDEGRPVAPGEMGRVIVTPLYNSAMPLIRYETGDYAIRAKRIQCSRSTSGLSRIVGRERNLFRLPDGRRIVPRLARQSVDDLALQQFKLVQRTLTDIEVLYVPRDPSAEFSREDAQYLVDKYMTPGFRVYCTKVAELPRTTGGKYLMHESMVS